MKARVLMGGCVRAMASATAGEAGNDRRWFDPGFDMREPSGAAPPATADAAFLIGEWAVTYERFAGDSLVEQGEGVSRFGYLNRGHGLVERFECASCGPGGVPLHELSFWVFNPTGDRWMMGSPTAHRRASRSAAAPRPGGNGDSTGGADGAVRSVSSERESRSLPSVTTEFASPTSPRPRARRGVSSAAGFFAPRHVRPPRHRPATARRPRVAPRGGRIRLSHRRLGHVARTT